MKQLTAVVLLVIALTAGYFIMKPKTPSQDLASTIESQPHVADVIPVDTVGGPTNLIHPMQIDYLREQEYPGSDIIIEQTLSPGSNYQRYIVSYKSEGLKQYALLTVPNAEPPQGGYPAIVFNHGYIAPQEYRTTERYIAYTDGFSRNGYVLLRPDYRGHGNSEGEARGGYGSADYTIDVLNAFTSLQKYPDVNPDRIGMWGHSMGGWITQNAMVINPDIKAGVIWGGVVGSYADLSNEWWARRARTRPTPTASPAPGDRGYWRYQMNRDYGTFEENAAFWDSLSAATYASELSGPIQLHHAKGDETVPYQLSEVFAKRLEDAGITVDLHLYEGDDHNVSVNFSRAMNNSVAWFNQYL